MVLEGLQSAGRRYEVYVGTGPETKKAGLKDVRRSLNHRYRYHLYCTSDREIIIYLAVCKLVLVYL